LEFQPERFRGIHARIDCRVDIRSRVIYDLFAALVQL
jgi:hypothetical protein